VYYFNDNRNSSNHPNEFESDMEIKDSGFYDKRQRVNNKVQCNNGTMVNESGNVGMGDGWGLMKSTKISS